MASRFHSGFTLLELLVAISIFSVIGLGAHQMLRTVTESHDRVKLSVDTYTQINLAYSIIQRDFNQFVPRTVRDEYGEPLPAISFESDDYAVEFTRKGWTNPAAVPRSSLQRVAYSIDYDTEELYRHFWKVLDRAEDSEPVSQLLLSGVTDFRVTGFIGEDVDEETQSLFDDEEFTDTAPVAVEVAISSEGFGEVVRMFQLVDPFSGNTASASPNLGSDVQDDVQGNEDAGGGNSEE